MSEHPAHEPELPYLREPRCLADFRDAEAVIAREESTGWEESVFDASQSRLRPDGTFEKKRPLRTMIVLIDRSRGELEMLRRDCLRFKGGHS